MSNTERARPMAAGRGRAAAEATAEIDAEIAARQAFRAVERARFAARAVLPVAPVAPVVALVRPAPAAPAVPAATPGPGADAAAPAAAPPAPPWLTEAIQREARGLHGALLRARPTWRETAPSLPAVLVTGSDALSRLARETRTAQNARLATDYAYERYDVHVMTWALDCLARPADVGRAQLGHARAWARRWLAARPWLTGTPAVIAAAETAPRVDRTGYSTGSTGAPGRWLRVPLRGPTCHKVAARAGKWSASAGAGTRAVGRDGVAPNAPRCAWPERK